VVPGKIGRSEDDGGRLDSPTNVTDLSQAPCPGFFVSGTPPVSGMDSTDGLWLSSSSLSGAEDPLGWSHHRRCDELKIARLRRDFRTILHWS
jgi:hypothetical protein